MTDTWRAIEGFDTGISPIFGMSGAFVSLSSTITSFSRYSMRMNPSNQSGNMGFGTYGSYGQGSAGVAGGYMRVAWHMYIATLPGGGQYFYMAHHTNPPVGLRGWVRLRSDGKLDLWGEGGTGAIDTTTNALTTGKWYVVTYEMPTFRVKVRDRDTGVTVIDHSYSSTANGVNAFYLGPGAGNSYGDVYYDNCVAESDASASNVDDPVNTLSCRYSVAALMSKGTGYYDDWTGTWADCDEVPHDSDTTYRQSISGTTHFTHTVDPITGLVSQIGVVYAVVGQAITRCTGTQTGSIAPVLVRSNTTDSLTGTTSGMSTGYAGYGLLLVNDPATAAPWTASAVGAAQVGVERYSSGPAHRTTQAALQVLYTLAEVNREPQIAYLLNAWDERQLVFNPYGEALLYDRVRSNAWMQIPDMDDPDLTPSDDFYSDPTMTYIEGRVYVQDADEGITVSLQGSPEDFIDRLLAKMNASGAGI